LTVIDVTVSDRRCINTGAFYIANGAQIRSVILMILFHALPIVWGLALKKKDKLTLRALFGLGGVSCIINIVRLKVLIAYLKKKHKQSYVLSW
jgi:ABC-type polysaccharide/polyol phosphate export permease